MWQLSREDLSSPRQGHTGAVLSLCFHPLGEEIVSGSTDRTLKFWTLEGELKSTFQYKGHTDAIRDICFQPVLIENQDEKERWLATASDDGTVKLWIRRSKTPRQTLQHGGKVRAVSFSSDGQAIASGGSDTTVKLWSLAGELLHILEGHQDWVLDVKFSPDSQIIASASSDSTVKLWNRNNGTLISSLLAEREDDWIYSVSFSPDGSQLVYACDNTLRLWSINENRLLARLTGHSDLIYSVCFSPDGTKIISASHDQTLRLWKADGTFLKTLNEHHGDAIRDVAFSPDGHLVASASDDRTIRLWNLNQDTEYPISIPQQEEPNLEELKQFACKWLSDYLRTNPNLSVSDRRLCEDIC